MKTVTEKALRQYRLDYINSILQTSLDERNSKPFWKYIKSQKNSKEKAEILNAQFKSVSTKLKKSVTPSISGNKYPAIGKLNISLNNKH